MSYLTFGPYLTANNRDLISVMHTARPRKQWVSSYTLHLLFGCQTSMPVRFGGLQCMRETRRQCIA
jgi:hypothetical protein